MDFKLITAVLAAPAAMTLSHCLQLLLVKFNFLIILFSPINNQFLNS